MTCDICRNKPAAIHFWDYAKENGEEKNLCKKCADWFYESFISLDIEPWYCERI